MAIVEKNIKLKEVDKYIEYVKDILDVRQIGKKNPNVPLPMTALATNIVSYRIYSFMTLRV